MKERDPLQFTKSGLMVGLGEEPDEMVQVFRDLRGVGVSSQDHGQEARGSALASYLRFEAPFTRELIALGEADTFARRDEVVSFFGWDQRGGAQPQRSASAEGLLAAGVGA